MALWSLSGFLPCCWHASCAPCLCWPLEIMLLLITSLLPQILFVKSLEIFALASCYRPGIIKVFSSPFTKVLAFETMLCAASPVPATQNTKAEPSPSPGMTYYLFLVALASCSPVSYLLYSSYSIISYLLFFLHSFYCNNICHFLKRYGHNI